MLFLESPWPILIVGLVIEMVLAIGLFRTGRGAVLVAMGGVALLVLLGVLIGIWSPTDTKRVRQTLEAAAAGLQANNAKQVDACIVPDADGNRARELVVWALSQAEFRELTIRNLEVKFNSQVSPPTAETTFTVWVRGTDRSAHYRRDLPARGNGRQAPQGVGPLAGLRRAQARRAAVAVKRLNRIRERHDHLPFFLPIDQRGWRNSQRLSAFKARYRQGRLTGGA